MSIQDRHKWDAKYSDPAFAPREPSAVLTSLAEILPCSGRAIDVAGGAGRHSIWLARRGLDVTLADIFSAGLAQARARAEEAHVPLTTLHTDLQDAPFPTGPWDLIVSICFLWRPLFAVYPHVLSTGGMLVVIQPTKTNLQRHDRPPADFLLDDGELPRLVQGLKISRYEEGWLADGRHDALIVATK